MAGINLTGDRRSQLLEQLLAQSQQRPQIQSGGELAARLGAQLLRQKQTKNLQGQEADSQQALVDALRAGNPTEPQTLPLEDFEDSQGVSFDIAGKKADPSSQRDAISQLPPEQQLQAMQLLAGQRELDQPTQSEVATTQFGRQKELQTQSESASDRRTDKQIQAGERSAVSRFAQRDKELMAKLDADELSQVRGIQAQIDLLDKKIAAQLKSDSLKGPKITDTQRVSAGYAARMDQSNATINDVGDEFSGFKSRIVGVVPEGFRFEKRQKFEQAKRNFINAVLRRESGAVISDAEFENADLQYFTQPGDKEEVLKEKTENRRIATAAMRLAGGDAYSILKQNLAEPQGDGATSDFSEGQTATGKNGERIVFRNGEWVPQ